MVFSAYFNEAARNNFVSVIAKVQQMKKAGHPKRETDRLLAHYLRGPMIESNNDRLEEKIEISLTHMTDFFINNVEMFDLEAMKTVDSYNGSKFNGTSQKLFQSPNMDYQNPQDRHNRSTHKDEGDNQQKLSQARQQASDNNRHLINDHIDQRNSRFAGGSRGYGSEGSHGIL